MKITKYVKKGNGNYCIILDDNTKITVNEEVILKYNLLYKKEITEDFLTKIITDNNKYDMYNKCIKYIGVRLRSTNEIREYLLRHQLSEEEIEKIIAKLMQNNLLNDSLFAKAFVNDKLNFTTMGPYRIAQELAKHKIDKNIISKYIDNIDSLVINNKIIKQINKMQKANKKNENIKNKIYNRLISLGYPSDAIINNLNQIDF